MQWTVPSNDGQVALETGESPIKITSLKLSMGGGVGECWSINHYWKLVAMS
jgi:hypothetical protein